VSTAVSPLRLPPYNAEGALMVVIETPKGSHNKYDFEPACGCLTLVKVLPEGMVFPYDFGFIPSTLADDGDPLDVLVLLDTAVPPLCVLQARLVGAIQARQKETGHKWIRNDRLIAVGIHTHTQHRTRSLADLPPHWLTEIKSFFVEYNKLQGRKFDPLGDHGPKVAAKVVEAGVRQFKRLQQ
jgi:inorganic pyrophosphatase